MNGRYWNPNTAERKAFSANCVAMLPNGKKRFIGDRANGKIYEMTGTTDDGDDIKTEMVSQTRLTGAIRTNGNFVQRSI
jgi:hypothetical protein